MVALAERLIDLIERSEERSGLEDLFGSSRRGSATPLAGVSAARLKNLFEMIYKDHPEASKAVLYRVFRREAENRLHARMDYYMEERLWAIIEERVVEGS